MTDNRKAALEALDSIVTAYCKSLGMEPPVPDHGSQTAAQVKTIRAALSSPQWEPIDSAPRDGSKFLGYVPIPHPKFCQDAVQVFVYDTRDNGRGGVLRTPDAAGHGFNKPTMWLPYQPPFPAPPATKGIEGWMIKFQFQTDLPTQKNVLTEIARTKIMARVHHHVKKGESP